MAAAMPRFRIQCPKCTSTNTYIEKDSSSAIGAMVLVCWACGKRVYGEPGIRIIVEPQYEEYLRHIKETKEAKRLAARRERERLRREELQIARCAWEGCNEPHRSRSKYCSRDCSNRNARARHSERQKAKAG